MVRYLLCHTGQHHRLPFTRKQTVSACLLHSRPVGKVIDIIFLLGDDIEVVLQRLRDKFGGILPCGFPKIVVILMHPVSILYP